MAKQLACIKCGAPRNTNSYYCPQCDKEWQNTHDAEENKTCQRCGGINTTAEDYCPACQAELNPQKTIGCLYSWLIFIAAWLILCLAAGFTCTLLKITPPKGILLVLIIIIPAAIIRWIIVRAIEKRLNTKQ
ncbi:MAG: hypothetical protein E7030_01535 [Akkermansiaceae bacterium]|nr:hypothetical protein [Akkermansiaceae bacterium]